MPSGRRVLRIAALVVLAFAVAVAVWLFIRARNDDGNAPPTSQQPAPTGGTTVVRANPRTLATLARLSRHPIYWAGPERNMKLELTQSRAGRIYVRYLPLNVKIGDRRGRYLVVGTYRVADAYSAIQKAARHAGAHRFRLRGGRVGVYNDDSPTNVYFAAPGSHYQVEVYDPNPKRTLALVKSGTVRPIRLTSSGG
jgi:hypothetical protein